MKAFLLAAGKGTRLKPYTDQHPKCLIPIHGTPLLQIWLDLLARHGVNEVLINTHHHAEQVEQFLAQARRRSAMALHTVYEPCLRGSAGTLWDNRHFISPNANFIIAYADNLTNLNLTKMIDFHKNIRSMGGVLTMGLIKADNPKACGIVSLDPHQQIVKFEEKPAHPESNLANAGVYVAGCEIFEALAPLTGDPAHAMDIGYHLLPSLIGKMFGYPVKGYLKDIGTPEAYQMALAQWPSEKK
jgi:mannose-1-phosphate guanylyltransferase